MYLQVVHHYDQKAQRHLAAIIHARFKRRFLKTARRACKKKRVKKIKPFIPNLLHGSKEGGVPRAHGSIGSTWPQFPTAGDS